MKLSDIKGDRVFDVIADIIDPICNIASDKNASDLFRRETPPDGMDARDFAAMKVRKAVPALMRGHKADLVAIFAAINGVTPKEYAETVTMASLLKDVTEMLTDSELMAFFS